MISDYHKHENPPMKTCLSKSLKKKFGY